MIGIRITKFIPRIKSDSNFESLVNIFSQLLLITSGNPAEALSWLSELDRKYSLTSPGYGIGNFIEDLKKRNFLKEDPVTGNLNITAKTELHLRKESLEEIFGKLKKTSRAELFLKNDDTYSDFSGEINNIDCLSHLISLLTQNLQRTFPVIKYYFFNLLLPDEFRSLPL